MDESEKRTKVADSAYSTSCSNSQSRRSHSSKSGSHSSGSSGYGEKASVISKEQSTSAPGVRHEVLAESPAEAEQEEPVTPVVPEPTTPKPDVKDVILLPPPLPVKDDSARKPSLGVVIKEEMDRNSCLTESQVILCTSRQHALTQFTNGFSCVISMHDGVVMYTTPTMTATLGFPRDMWVGRSFIDFVHPKDRNSFASEIMNSVDVPREAPGPSGGASMLTMCCRIRTYRGLSSGFGVKNHAVTFMPFILNLSFKDIDHEDGKTVYLVVQATPFSSAFKLPNETPEKVVPFTTRHLASGKIELADPTSVPYLGYLPQDVVNTDALDLYHPDDLGYILQMYEKVIRDGSAEVSQPYRLKAQNGFYVRLETEFSSFMNPWTKKLEFICGKHVSVEGPPNPDVFQSPVLEKPPKTSEDYRAKIQNLRLRICKVMSEVPKFVETAKKQMSKRCLELAAYMENLIDDSPRATDPTRFEVQDTSSYYERDTVMLGGISPHYENESKSSSETPLSYTQLNYNENLQRYFDSYQPVTYEEASAENVLDEIGSDYTLQQLTHSEMHAVNALLEDCMTRRLSEKLLLRHNTEMERELMKKHREHKTMSKAARDRMLKENRLKKQAHLARCNAAYQTSGAPSGSRGGNAESHGTKRRLQQFDRDSGSYKHHCPVAHKDHTRHITFDVLAPNYQYNNTSSNADLLPMYYLPTTKAGLPVPVGNCMLTVPGSAPVGSTSQLRSPVPYVMTYPSTVFGASFMYSPIAPQVASPGLQAWMDASAHHQHKQSPMGPNRNHYDEACKSLVKITKDSVARPSTTERRCGPKSGFLAPIFGSPGNSDSMSGPRKFSSLGKISGEERSAEKTDGESSYSSFCSSFFKTDTSSTDESDSKKAGNYSQSPRYRDLGSEVRSRDVLEKKICKRKQPPWMEHACLTPDFVYKYQMVTQSMEDVLEADKRKMSTLEQPYLVNEQLSQLYVDMQLTGGPARLILEEGITSSGSSGEENVVTVLQTKKQYGTRRKREYSRLVMIYEEEAPLPPPPQGNDLLGHDLGPSVSVSTF